MGSVLSGEAHSRYARGYTRNRQPCHHRRTGRHPKKQCCYSRDAPRHCRQYLSDAVGIEFTVTGKMGVLVPRDAGSVEDEVL